MLGASHDCGEEEDAADAGARARKEPIQSIFPLGSTGTSRGRSAHNATVTTKLMAALSTDVNDMQIFPM